MSRAGLLRKPAMGGLLAWLWLTLLPPGVWAAADGAWLDALRARDTVTLRRLAAGDPGVPVDAALADGTTALMVAAKQGPPELVERLIRLGADVRAENTRGGTALMYAAVTGDVTVMGRLLEEGARIDKCASNGWSALTIAAAKGRTAALMLLLARGAHADVADIYGGTPLIRAVGGGYAEAVRMLLERGEVDVDAQDESGATALHHAAARGDLPLVRLLLAHGADPSRRTGTGHTPQDVARLGGREGLAAVLAVPAGGVPSG